MTSNDDNSNVFYSECAPQAQDFPNQEYDHTLPVVPESQDHVSPNYNYSIPMCSNQPAMNQMQYHQFLPYGMGWWQPQFDHSQYAHYMNNFPYLNPMQPIQNPQIDGKSKSKSCRAPYTSKQLEVLRRRFEQNDRIEMKERQILSKEINLTPHQIKVWFQNRRFKVRRDNEKREKLKATHKSEIESRIKQSEEVTPPFDNTFDSNETTSHSTNDRDQSTELQTEEIIPLYHPPIPYAQNSSSAYPYYYPLQNQIA